MPPSRNFPPPRQRGFALLITVTLLAFLVLLLVSLASLTRVETQVASNNQNLTQARQNALFALNIALGQLQKAAGPDQRVTAAAETLANTDPTKKKWTGVWDTRSANFAAAPVWLVSQTTPAAADNPRNDTPAPTLAATVSSNATAVRLVGSKSADIATSGPSGSPANAGNEIVVPLQDIKSDASPGLGGASATVGRFGYWVGDEGVKARINLTDPYAGKTDTLSLINRVDSPQRSAWELFSGSTSPTPAATDPATVMTEAILDQSGRMLSARQIALLASADSGAPSGAGDALSKIATGRFHDYTLWSAGVQADVKNGGLKWDLSTAFDLSDTLFATSEFSTRATQVRDSTNVIQSPVDAFTPPGGLTAPKVSFAFLPKVQFPGAASTAFLRGPTWHLLRSHYQLYKSQSPVSATPSAVTARSIYPGGRRAGLGGQENIPSLFEVNATFGGGTKDPNSNLTIPGTSPAKLVPRVTQSSVAPYINRIFIRFGVRTVPKRVTTSAGTIADVYAVQLVMTPFVVLHNPYGTEVRFNSYSKKASPGPVATPNIAAQINLFAATSRGLPITTRVIVDGYDYMTKCTFNNGAGNGLLSLGANDYGDGWPRFKLLIPETVSLKPGELKVLYPQMSGGGALVLSKGPPDTTYVTLDTTPNLQGGFVFSLLNGQRKSQQVDGAYLSDFNAGNNEVNPPLVPTGGTIPAGVALTKAEFTAALASAGTGSATEIWANSPGSPIQVVMNTVGGNFEIKYAIESVDPVSGGAGPSPDDATSVNTDASSMTYQLDGIAPPYLNGGSASGLDTYLAEYTRYSKVPAPGFSRADDYRRPGTPLAAGTCTTPKYLFGLDYYAKAADHDAARATRPFITSNPVAPVQFSTALGNQTSTSANGTSGFPKIMPAYQLEFVDINPSTGSNLSDSMYVDSNGNAIWGPHNGNDGLASSNLDGSSPGLPFVPLINIPSRPLTSIADLQHANIALFGYQPYFAVGNSYASPYVAPGAALNPVGYSGGSPAANNPNPGNPYFLQDLSYLMNDALWDKYFFSSLGQEFNGGSWGSTDAALSASVQTWAAAFRTAANARMVPYNSVSSSRTAAANLSNIQSAYRLAAASLLTQGSFNVNSRSVDAWAAILGAARGLDVVADGSGATTTVNGGTSASAATPIPRMLPIASRSDANPLSSAAWKGFAALSDAQIRQLAKNIVAEITRRQTGTTVTHTGATMPATNSYSGPFRSLSDFVNRNLVSDLASGASSTGAMGALQAALDEPSNADSPNRAFFTGTSYRDVSDAQNDSKWRFVWGGVSNHLAGKGPTTSTATGFILQADVLQQIGSFLSARSDTFVIRTFGESLVPVTGESAGKAWCEAVVQRLPDYVDQSDADLTANSVLGVPLYDAAPPYVVSPTGVVTTKLSTANQTFGRRFKIVSFRWLTAQDI